MTRFILTSAAALMLLASPAMAAPSHDRGGLSAGESDGGNTGAKYGREGTSTSYTSAEQCRTLMGKIDQSMPAKPDSPKLVKARELGARGERECRSGNTTIGAADLRHAISTLNANG
jgi:hypothetical protein